MRKHSNLYRQQGVVLIVSLLVLVLVTLLAISTVNKSTLLQRMAGNSQGLNSAFQAAENGFIYFLEELEEGSSVDAIGVKRGSFYDGSEYEAKKADDVECFLEDSESSSVSSGSGTLVPICFEIISKGQFGDSETIHHIGYATRTVID